MAKEILVVPEECLEEVIKVIRAGLEHVEVSEEVRENLVSWCLDEEDYLGLRRHES